MNRTKFSVFLLAILLGAGFLAAPRKVSAQTTSSAEIVLVLPFENTSEHREYNWIGESFAESLTTLLDKPGLIIVSSDERAVAYQRLRLPQTVIPSRATTIKIARELKATMVVFGTYNVTVTPGDKSSPQGETPVASIIGQAKVIRVNEGRLAGDIFDGSWAPRQYDFADSVKELQKLQGELAYQVL